MQPASYLLVSLLLSLSTAVVGGSKEHQLYEDQCPPWTEGELSRDIETDCVCGASVTGVIQCNNLTKQAVISIGWCVTPYAADEDNSSLVAGTCPYLPRLNSSDRVSFILPRDRAQLVTSQCSHYHRAGLLCGECVEGYGPSGYSFDQSCSNCSHISTAGAALLYCTLEAVPITAFFLLLMALEVNIISGPMFGYVIFCQYFIVVIRNEKAVLDSVTSDLPSSVKTSTYFSLTLSAIWSLLFFRFLVPPFCISPKLSGLHLVLLRLSTALIPWLLVSTVCVVLRGELQRIAGVKHVYRCGRRFFKGRVNSANVVRVFATFILMSMSIVIFETNSLVLCSPLYNTTGTIAHQVLFYDPAIELFSLSHTLYLCLALTLTFLLVFCPGLVLLVYPTSLYQPLSHRLGPRHQLTVKIFAETFNGSFKDGLNGTRDCRIIPGLALVSAVGYIIMELFSPHKGSVGNTYIVGGFVDIGLSLVLGVIQPCKTWAANTSLSFHFTLLGVWSLLFGMWVENLILGTRPLALVLCLLPLLPHLLMGGWALWKLVNYLKNRCHAARGQGEGLGEAEQSVCCCLSSQESQLGQWWLRAARSGEEDTVGPDSPLMATGQASPLTVPGPASPLTVPGPAPPLMVTGPASPLTMNGGYGALDSTRQL